MPIWVIGGVTWGAQRLWRTRKTPARGWSHWRVWPWRSWPQSNHVPDYRYPPAVQLNAIKAPELRRTRTDELLGLLEVPIERPIVVALEAVQLRYEVDDRVVVRSLDGRVDRLLLRFADGGTVDHVGDLRARQVDAVVEAIGYNRSREDLVVDRAIPASARRKSSTRRVVFRRLGAQRLRAVTALYGHCALCSQARQLSCADGAVE